MNHKIWAMTITIIAVFLIIAAVLIYWLNANKENKRNNQYMNAITFNPLATQSNTEHLGAYRNNTITSNNNQLLGSLLGMNNN